MYFVDDKRATASGGRAGGSVAPIRTNESAGLESVYFIHSHVQGVKDMKHFMYSFVKGLKPPLSPDRFEKGRK